MSDACLLPAHVEAVLEALDVPADERFLPLQRVLDTGHVLEVRMERGRHFLFGLLHEFPIPPGDSVIESLLEAPFQAGACGYLAYESAEKRLVYWSEILPSAQLGGIPSPDLRAFLREVTELSKKVSLAGAL